MSMAQDLVYALLADGTTVEIRPAGPGDFDAVKAMHKAMSPDNTYLRFFNISRMAAEIEARRICRDPAPGQVALLALAGRRGGRRGQLRPAGTPGQAEVAFAVADHMHHRGIATLLLEHLVSYARSHQITTFTAETLTENKAMLNVFADAGLPVERHLRGRGLRADVPAAQRGRRRHARQLPERRGRTGAPRRGRQPAARARARVGRGDRREPAAGDGGPGHPGQHPGRRVRRPALHGEPARPADRRRAVPVLGARPARGRRPGGDRGARRDRARRGRAVRPARRAVPGGDHRRAGRRRPRRPARGVPQARHAAGRPGLLRGGRARHRPGRHVRRPPGPAGRGGPGHAVRRPGLRHGRSPVPARHRDLLVRVGGRQARRVQQRHADVVGTATA